MQNNNNNTLRIKYDSYKNRGGNLPLDTFLWLFSEEVNSSDYYYDLIGKQYEQNAKTE